MKAPVAVYEGIWRPLGYFIASKHSFPKDLDRIANLIHRPNRVVLDLASGPGNVTRRLARLMPDSTIVGFDLSAVMLGRAVRLTREEGLRNIYYMRGSALSLPFQVRNLRRRQLLRRASIVSSGHWRNLARVEAWRRVRMPDHNRSAEGARLCPSRRPDPEIQLVLPGRSEG